jgi:hypothetical protein
MVYSLVRLSSLLDAKGQYDLADRIDRVAMPYRWEQTGDRARQIVDHGYDPRESIFTYIDEYSDQFAEDLSNEAKIELEAYADEIGLVDELNTYGRGGRRWDKYIDKLADLWMGEHPDEVLLWLAEDPNHALEFGDPDTFGYQENLLRYNPEDGDSEPFLSDHAYGYATKVRVPPGRTSIPGDRFEVVSPEEWQKHRDDPHHWASERPRFLRLAAEETPGVKYELADGMDRVAGYSSQLGMLNQVLKQGYSPHFYDWNVPKFLGPEADIEPSEGEASDWIENASPEQLEEFRDFNERHPISENSPWDAPPFESMDYRGVTRPQWQIHFTNNPWDVASQGFTHGYRDIEGVAYTNGRRPNPSGGFNFSFDPRDAPNESPYGEHAVIFPSGAVQTYHHGDEEHQNVFWGPSVDPRMIFPVERTYVNVWDDEFDEPTEDLLWVVKNWDDRPVFSSEDIQDCVGWVDRNWRQLYSAREKIERKK